jgi:hypothetical protein
MEREKLRELTEGFLKTYGYISKPTNNPNCTLFSRPTVCGCVVIRFSTNLWRFHLTNFVIFQFFYCTFCIAV